MKFAAALKSESNDRVENLLIHTARIFWRKSISPILGNGKLNCKHDSISLNIKNVLYSRKKLIYLRV